jgi:hypothetical protein
MRKGRLWDLSLLCAALMGTTALCFAGPAMAQSSKVGVTSATDGDPLGKPPTEAERVLKIGIDVQANEVVTTKANDRAHLVFLDGTSLTVGPNARLTIDKFVYDPNTKTGDLAITTTQGVFRLVGGKISKTNAITINTPSSTIGIRGGITMFNVNQKGTTAAFLFGHNMTVSGQGQTQNVTRPGSAVTVNTGAAPSPPTLLPPGGLSSLVSSLEGSSNSSSSGGSGSGGTGGGTGGSGADQKAAASQLPGTNSGSSSAQAPPSAGPTPGAGGGGPPTQVNNAVANAVNSTNPATNNPQSAVQTTTTTTTVMTPTVTTGTQVGYVGGIVVRNGGETVLTNALGASDSTPNLTITRDASGNVSTTVIVRGLDGTLTSPNATLSFNSDSRGFFQDDVTSTFGTTNGRGTLSPVPGHGTIRIHHNTSITPGVGIALSSCTCDFLTFGLWSTTITEGHHHHQHEIASITSAPWVTGQLAVQLPNTQQATYTGPIIALAQDGSGSPIRLIGGSFTDTFSFASRSGNATAVLDGRTLSGSFGMTSTTGVGFQGALSNGAGYTGTFGGSFVSGQAGSIPAGQIGAIKINGPTGSNYTAGGVFGTVVVPGSVH